MMPRRTHRAERARRIAVQHRIGGGDAAPAARNAASAEAGDNTVSGSRCTRDLGCVSSTVDNNSGVCTRSN
jgi:hypothetical protein